MQFAALDTHFLLALERGNPESQDAFDCLSKLRFFPLITGTVARNLAYMVENAVEEEAKRIAKNTIIHIPTFVILDRVAGYDGNTAEMAHQLLAGPLRGGTNTEALIVAEAAYEKCEVLITLRKSLLIKSKQIAFETEKVYGKPLYVIPPVVISSAARNVQRILEEQKAATKKKK